MFWCSEELTDHEMPWYSLHIHRFNRPESEEVAHLVFPQPWISALDSDRNREVAPWWRPTLMAEHAPGMALTGAVDPHKAVIAWFTPLPEGTWHGWAGARLPRLVDGPLTLAFPSFPSPMPTYFTSTIAVGSESTTEVGPEE